MSKSKKGSKKGAAPKPDTEAAASAAKPIIRAIRVTEEVLAAAKAYRKEKGVSFYQLGLEAISERLAREGFLKAREAKA